MRTLNLHTLRIYGYSMGRRSQSRCFNSRDELLAFGAAHLRQFAAEGVENRLPEVLGAEAPLLDACDDRLEVIIQQDDVGGLLCDLTYRNKVHHGKHLRRGSSSWSSLHRQKMHTVKNGGRA